MEMSGTSQHSAMLQQFVYKLYQDQMFCDLEIESLDGTTLWVHKLIMMASSKYIHNLCVATPGLQKLQIGVQTSVLYLLVEFCYTGHLYVHSDNCRNVQEGAILLQMSTAKEILSNQMMQVTSSSLLTSVEHEHELVAGNTEFTTMRDQPFSDINVSTYTDISTTNYTLADPCVTEHIIEDTSNYNEIIVKMEENEDSQIQDKHLKSTHESDKNVFVRSELRNMINVIQNNSDTSAYSEQQVSVVHERSNVKHDSPDKSSSISRSKVNNKVKGQTKGHSTDFTQTDPYVSVVDGDLDLKRRSPRSKGNKVKDHSEGQTSKRSQSEAKSSVNELSNVGNKHAKYTYQYVNKKQSANKDKTGIDNLSNFGDKKKILLKIECLKATKISERVKSAASKTQAYSPKRVNRSCLLCKKSISSVAELLYHRTYIHPLKICSYLRYKFAVKQCKKQSLVCSYFKRTLMGKKRYRCKMCGQKFKRYCQFSNHHLKKHRTSSKSKQPESWLRFCSLKLALLRLIVPLAKDRKCRRNEPEVAKAVENLDVGHRCIECNKTFHSSKGLSAHSRMVHMKENKVEKVGDTSTDFEKKLFVCYDCQASFASQRSVCLHLQNIHKYSKKEAEELQALCPETITCEVKQCGYTAKSLDQMLDHVMKLHPDITYPCSKCPMSFKLLLMLKRHVMGMHTEGSKLKFSCQLCDKSFSKGLRLRNHEYFKHGIHHDNIKVYNCEHPGCKYQTYASSAIRLHQSKHVKEKLFPCEYCGMKLKTETIHKKHVDKTHLGIRPFLCQVCGLSFGEKHELQSHITNRHTSEKNYQCDHCVYSTSVKATFYTHLFNRHGVRADDDKRELFKCPQCPFTSIIRHRYQIHLNSHTNTRNYECEICSKTFVSANTLRSHRQWHHSDKMYTCTQCEYQTKTSQKLNEHIRVQHQLQGFKPYKCPYCSFRCATGGNTRKHVKQVHKGQEVTYIRDDELLTAARNARASGHYSTLIRSLPTVDSLNKGSFTNNTASQSDEQSELSDNILHIVM